MKKTQSDWTRDQTIVALSVYCKVPFNKVSSTNPEIVKTAKQIGRSANSVKMKVGNFGSFDPELRKRGIVGLGNASKLCEQIWNEYYNNWEKLSFDSANILSNLTQQPIAQVCGLVAEDGEFPQGQEQEVTIKQRINQVFFRNAVLSSYNYSCCISGIARIDLLEACHIVDWANDLTNRLNPSNGLCLNPFFHKAYDRNYIAITPEYKVLISEKLFDESTLQITKEYLHKFHNSDLHLPDRFMPNKELLALHYEKYKK